MRQHAVVVAGEQREQLELFRRQADLVAVVASDAAAVVVDRQVADREDPGVGASSAATRRSATRMRASSSSGPNGLVT